MYTTKEQLIDAINEKVQEMRRVQEMPLNELMNEFYGVNPHNDDNEFNQLEESNGN